MSYKLEDSISYLFNRNAVLCKLNLSDKIKDFNITYEQWLLIFIIVKNEGLTQRELSEKAFKDQPNITRSLTRLEEKEFIKRISNSKDKRIFNIYPTEKSKDLYLKILPTALEFNNMIISNFTIKEKEIFYALIEKLFKNLN
jgi:MarR family transcriptional regulator, transcriptional regulator for hemolysin